MMREFGFGAYRDYLERLQRKLPPSTIERMKGDRFSAFNDPAGDNYHFYRGYDYDAGCRFWSVTSVTAG